MDHKDGIKNLFEVLGPANFYDPDNNIFLVLEIYRHEQLSRYFIKTIIDNSFDL